MAKRLPENKEARYQIRLQRDNHRNVATGHSPREAYQNAATAEVIKWSYGSLPRSEFDRIHEKHMKELCRLQDERELRGNHSELRDALGDVRRAWDEYTIQHGINPSSHLVRNWMHEALEPLKHLNVGVPDRTLSLVWAKPIAKVSREEIERMGQLRDANISRASIGRQNVKTLEDALFAVGAKQNDSLGLAFNL